MDYQMKKICVICVICARHHAMQSHGSEDCLKSAQIPQDFYSVKKIIMDYQMNKICVICVICARHHEFKT